MHLGSWEKTLNYKNPELHGLLPNLTFLGYYNPYTVPICYTPNGSHLVLLDTRQVGLNGMPKSP